MTMTETVNAETLFPAAQALAAVRWPMSIAALRPTFVREARNFVADWALSVTEKNPPTDQPVYVTFLVVNGDEWMMDPASLNVQDLGGTDLGDQFDEEIAGEWILRIAEHLAAQPDAGHLLDWANARVAVKGAWAETTLEAIIEDNGCELGVDEFTYDLRNNVINEVGRMTLAEIIALDEGGAARRLDAARDEQRAAYMAAAERKQAAQTFYEQQNAAFFDAVGVHGRKLEAADFPAVISAVHELGWSAEQRALFSEGAPFGTFSTKAAERLAWKTLK